MSKETSLFEFEGYRLDDRLRQLRRGSEIVPLPSKAFDLLAYMVQHPGRPLGKEELLAAVWPNSFVEEANLSQNVFQLRKALGQSDTGAPIIVTLPGRGYQFTAPVSALPAVPLDSEGVDPRSPAPLEPELAEEAHYRMTRSRLVLEESLEERIAWFRSRSAWVILGGGVLVTVLAGWLGWQRWEDHVGGPPVQVVVAGFQGGTGDGALDLALNAALRAGLSQSPYVTLVSGATIRQTLGLMTLKPDAELTPSVARDVCERTGSQAVLRGVVAQTGNHFLLTGEATGCADGATIATFREEAGNRDGLPHAVDKLAAELRHGLGESRRTIARFSQPLLSSMGRTNSMEALEAWSQAGVQSQSGHFPEAIELLKHAVALDPEFAAAWLDLSSYAANMNDRAGMIEYLRKAYAVREQAILPARYLIEARYASEVQGDLFGAEQSYQAMLGLYPRNATALSALGEVERQIGHHAEAANALSRALVLAPNYAALYYGVCTEEAKSGRLDDAKRACESGLAHGLDSDLIRLALIRLAMIEHDPQLYAQQAAWADEHRSSLLLATEAQGDLLQGRVHDALGHLDRACAALGAQQARVCSQYRFGVASLLATMGEAAQAHKLIDGLTPDPSDDNGLPALVQTGRLHEAEAGLKAHEAEYPSSPAWEAKVGEIVRAYLLLAEHRPAEVEAVLEPERPFEGSGLDSWYLRALGFQQSGQHEKAIAEFRRLLAHQAIDPGNIAIPMSQLGLARSLAAAHRRDDALNAYQDFFTSWAHADPDVIVLAEAHHEYDVLRALSEIPIRS